jgi:glycosyltransferase involved in cell wall biosynthesis
MRVSILTRSLTRGGAQVQVVTLARGLAKRGHAVQIVVFYGGGALDAQAEDSGAKLVQLGKSGRWSLVRPFRRLIRHLKESRAEVIYSFLAMENLVGLAAARVAGCPIVWGVRGAAVNRAQYGFASRILYGAQFRLMRSADAVICNSRAAAKEIPGRRARALHVVANGIDTIRYAPSTESRLAWRARHGFDDSIKVVGIVARLDPMKDHGTFLAAAGLAARARPELRFVVAGSGPTAYAARLRDHADRLALSDRILWLGEVADPLDVYRGLDVLVSSSAYGEGFSNAIGEGMACGVATVTTDVGDGRMIVGSHGRVVDTRSPAQISGAILDLLACDDVAARVARRNWIVGEFGVDAMVERTEKILGAVASRDDANKQED